MAMLLVQTSVSVQWVWTRSTGAQSRCTGPQQDRLLDKLIARLTRMQLQRPKGCLCLHRHSHTPLYDICIRMQTALLCRKQKTYISQAFVGKLNDAF